MVQSFLNKHALNMLHQNSPAGSGGKKSCCNRRNVKPQNRIYLFIFFNRELSELFPLCESFQFYRVPLMSRVSEIVCIFAGIYVHTLFLMTTLLVIKITGPKLGKHS